MLEVPVFRPTLEEAQGSWEAYMEKIEPDYDQVCGLGTASFQLNKFLHALFTAVAIHSLFGSCSLGKIIWPGSVLGQGSQTVPHVIGFVAVFAPLDLKFMLNSTGPLQLEGLVQQCRTQLINYPSEA